jgi:hypothetical protein
MSTNYSEYTTTIKTDISYYGGVTEDEVRQIVDRMQTSLREQFSGIEIRLDAMIGHAHRDNTTGPDQDVCEAIDSAKEAAFQTALAEF